MSEPHQANRPDPQAEVVKHATVFPNMSLKRWGGATAALVVLCLLYIPMLRAWYRVSMTSDLHSHVILIPLVVIYLLVTGRKDLDWKSPPSWLIGLSVMGLAAAVLGWETFTKLHGSETDMVALRALSFVGFVWGIGFLFCGTRWMRSAGFAMAFLLFMIPMPDFIVEQLERFLMMASAVLAEILFSIGGVPIFRNGQVLELPGMVLEVAEECSGIRSSWVLLITSLLAAHLLLPTLPRRIALVAAVLPLSILRNAVRIYVIGWLCVHYGPEMIHSWIHHKGGPVFFAASLVPLFLLAWWLRKKDVQIPRRESVGELEAKLDSDSVEN
jgi:exosortase C (VPDSG-CTERM-specific)